MSSIDIATDMKHGTKVWYSIALKCRQKHHHFANQSVRLITGNIILVCRGSLL